MSLIRQLAIVVLIALSLYWAYHSLAVDGQAVHVESTIEPSPASAPVKVLGEADSPSVRPLNVPPSGTSPIDKDGGDVTMSPKVWQEKLKAFRASTNYRSLIHEATINPTREGVAMAMRAWSRCAFVQKLWPETAAPQNIPQDLAGAFDAVKQACSQGTEDLSRALSNAARRVNLTNGLVDDWVIYAVKDGSGLRQVVSIGDGDLLWNVTSIAAVSGPSAVKRALGISDNLSGAEKTQMTLAIGVEACALFECDIQQRRLSICMNLGACTGTTLDEQVRSYLLSRGMNADAWERMRSNAHESLLQLKGY